MMAGVSDKGTPICCVVIEPKMGLKILVILEMLSIISFFIFLITVCFNKDYVVCEKSNLLENDSFIKELGPLVRTGKNNIEKLYEED